MRFHFAGALLLVAACGSGSDQPPAEGSVDAAQLPTSVDGSDALPNDTGSRGDVGAAPAPDARSDSGFGADVVLSDAALSPWPDDTNTGYRHSPSCSGGLTAWTGGAIQSGHTYECIEFGPGLGVGSTSSRVQNVTFRGCRFHGIAVGNALVVLYGDAITFDYCSFEPGVAAPPCPYDKSYQYGIAGNGGYGSVIQQLTVTHSDFWGFGNAIDTQGSTEAKPHLFRDNWIHDASDDGGAIYHTDGIGAESGAGTGSYVVIDHNTIESHGNTNGIAYQAGTYDHFTITNNLVGGFGYTVALLGGATYTTFTDNTFTTRLAVAWGPLYGTNFWTTTGSVWRRNRWKVPSGAAWGNPQHDGWYWLPDASGNSGASDASFVSQTDFGG
jgi:hypothetical protein